MKLSVVRSLRRVKKLHEDRADTARRARAAALAAALAAIEAARAALLAWQAEMPARAEAIYAEVMGRVVEQDALTAVRSRIAELRAHEQLLAHALSSCEAAAQEAWRELVAADAALAAARRAVTKFDELGALLRRTALQADERREEAELEEAAETLKREGDGDAGSDQAA